jgi:hypothetical protein
MERHTLTKSELAQLCEVSTGKVRQWCNVDFYDELVKLGYKKYQKIFTPRQTEFLKQHLVEFRE